MQVQIRKLRKKEGGVAIAAGHLCPGLLLIASIFMVVLSDGLSVVDRLLYTVNEMYSHKKLNIIMLRYLQLKWPCEVV